MAAAVPVVTSQQQQALFASKHAELVREARAVAREHGVTVCTVAFRPDGAGGVAHELIGGVGREEERLRDVIGRAVARDVSEMGPREVAAHHWQLRALRALVLRELQAKKETAAAAAAAAKDDGAGAAKTKRALEQRETDGSGATGNAAKSRRTD